jgi:hypothetical protein
MPVSRTCARVHRWHVCTDDTCGTCAPMARVHRRHMWHVCTDNTCGTCAPMARVHRRHMWHVCTDMRVLA